ncbi:MAG: glycosyltransferase family 4 protein, partial [Tumebacillaceae bacterium]
MNIWIFNHYAVGPGASGGTRHYDLAKELGKRGDQVTLFASSFEHQSRKERKFTPGVKSGSVIEEPIGDVRFVWIKTCAYTRNDWRRVVNMVGYTLRAFWVGLRRAERPDVIIGSLMHPLAALIGFLLAWIKGSTFYFEERDLWPQSLIDLGKVSERHPVVWLLRRLEHFLYRKAKRIIVLFDKAVDYVESQGFSREKVLYLPNGVDLSRFAGEDAPLSGELEEFFRQRSGAFISAYVGSHGISDRLDAVMETASLLKAQGERFHFLLIGDGPEKERLMRLKEEMGLDNVTFMSPVPKEMIPAILTRCQAGLMCLPDVELYKWGISFNKMYDYMAASLPIVLLSRYGESQLERSGGGVIVDAPSDMSEMLVHLADEPNWARA